MFPIGRAGIGLMLLRLSLSAWLLADASSRFHRLPFEWVCLVLIVAGSSVAIGLFTPFFAALACLLAIARLLDPNHAFAFEHLLATLNALSLALLGPGAYSVDARLFGRRIVSLVPGNGRLRRDDI